MKLLDKISSKQDNTIKFILQTDDNLIIEICYINKDDGKDIICRISYKPAGSSYSTDINFKTH